MKPLVQTIIILYFTGLLSGCSGNSDEPDKPVPNPPVAQNMEIRINPAVNDARATDYGFESGDCIGLYVVNYSGDTPGALSTTGNHVDNMRFRYDGSWVPDTPIYWTDNETHADFYLYYPYTNVQSVSAHAFSVKTDQSLEPDYKSSDLMVGKRLNVSPSNTATVIPADHVMSRVIITLEAGNGFTKELLAASAVSVRINGVRCNSTVNLATGAVTPMGEASSVIPLKVSGDYKALIVPQTVASGNLITVNVDGTDYNLVKGFTFESGRSHRFTVTLSKASGGVNVTINPWEDDGVDNGGIAE